MHLRQTSLCVSLRLESQFPAALQLSELSLAGSQARHYGGLSSLWRSPGLGCLMRSLNSTPQVVLLHLWYPSCLWVAMSGVWVPVRPCFAPPTRLNVTFYLCFGRAILSASLQVTLRGSCPTCSCSLVYLWKGGELRIFLFHHLLNSCFHSRAIDNVSLYLTTFSTHRNIFQ